MSHDLTRMSWDRMLRRCEWANDPYFSHYGGRGIKVCERWRGYPNGFLAFLADMGPRPSRAHSIDRIDNDGDYTPTNCRWATAKQQARNRRSNRTILAHGKTLTVVEWAETLGCGGDVIIARLDAGWTSERAVTTPVNRRRIVAGQVFGSWTALGESANRLAGGNRRIRCKCACGVVAEVAAYTLLSGRSRQCRSCALRGNKNARGAVSEIKKVDLYGSPATTPAPVETATDGDDEESVSG